MSASPNPAVFRVFAAACLATALAVSGCASRIGETNVHGIVVTEAMLAQVKPGTGVEAVVAALGTPSTPSTINGEAY